MNLSDKKKHYKAEIEKIASSVYNGEQKQLACYILDNANADNIDSIYTFITQRVKLGFTFDAAPEVNHNCISLVRHNPKLTFGNIGGEHKLIIGENYDALKNLLVTYTKDGKGLIDVIYIDPPYNTEAAKGEGNNYKDDVEAKKFIYRDKFTRNGWLNMMRERLVMARKLLSDTGVIFVSIDDTEQAYLKVLMDEIFGDNMVDVMVWRKSGVGRDGKMKNTTTFRKDHEYVLVAWKKTVGLSKSLEIPNFQNEYKNIDNDPRGAYKAGSISRKEEASNPNSPNYYTVTSPAGKKFTRQFDISEDEFIKLDKDGRIFWGKDNTSVPAIKIFLNEPRYVTTSSIIDYSNMTTTFGSKELDSILNEEHIGDQIRPKPSPLIKKLLQISSQKESIVLDFFAGSGTTGQAVMELNAADGGNRKCILVTNNENNIATDITYERLYRLVNGKGTKGEKFPWTYKPEQPYLTNNRWEVFELEQAELKIDDFDKAKELLAIAEKEFKLLNPNYDMKGLDIYNQLASLNPYKATDTDKKNDKCN